MRVGVRHSFCRAVYGYGAWRLARRMGWYGFEVTLRPGPVVSRGIPTVPYAHRANSSQLSVWAVLSSDSHNVIFPLTFCFSNFALTISYDNRLHTPPPRFVCLGTPLAMCVLPSVGVLLTAELRPQFVEQQRRDVRAAGGGGERQGSGRAARKGRGRTAERCPAIPLSGDSHTACSHTACSHAACSHRHCHLECSDHRCARDRLRGVEWSAIEVS